MRNETKWTKGPWYVAEATAYPSVKSNAVQGKRRGDKGVVTMYRSNEESAANAHLIAAAPELYEALAELDEAYCRAGGDLTREERFEDRGRLIAARAALSKARGEQS